MRWYNASPVDFSSITAKQSSLSKLIITLAVIGYVAQVQPDAILCRTGWVRDNLHDDSSLKHREINATHVPANAAKLNLHSALQARSLSVPLSLPFSFSLFPLLSPASRRCSCNVTALWRRCRVNVTRRRRQRKYVHVDILESGESLGSRRPSLADASLRVIITGISSKDRRYMLTSR